MLPFSWQPWWQVWRDTTLWLQYVFPGHSSVGCKFFFLSGLFICCASPLWPKKDSSETVDTWKGLLVGNYCLFSWRRRGWPRMTWLGGITESMENSGMENLVGKLWEMVRDREAWPVAVHGVTKYWTWLGNRTTTFLKLIFHFNWRLITLQYCGGFCHTLTWISHGCTCVPDPEPPPTTAPPFPSLQVVPVHQLWVPCFMHQTWTDDLFQIW